MPLFDHDTGHRPTYGTLGNAFLELQALAQPEEQYVIEMKEDEKQKKEHDDAAGSDHLPSPQNTMDAIRRLMLLSDSGAIRIEAARN